MRLKIEPLDRNDVEIFRKSGAFKVGAVVAVLSVVAAALYYFLVLPIADATMLPMFLAAGAGAAFLLLALIGAPKYGAAAMAALDFASLLVLLNDLVPYAISLITAMTMSENADITDVIKIGVVAGMLILCAIVANVVAWKRMKKGVMVKGQRYKVSWI